MKPETRIYADAFLQNVKNVAFFTFLPVLIARLGASDFVIALSNTLPAAFCALSLAFLTRQLPVTRRVFLASGYIRQVAFLMMALSVLLPNPFPALFFFWAINAVSVIVMSAQQPAIMRRHVDTAEFPKMFSRLKMIGIAVTTAGGFAIGAALDATDRFFPYNYVASMLIGCVSTFAGMSLIAELAPRESVRFRLGLVRPFRECTPRMWWMGLNQTALFMAQPLFVIYHVNRLGLSNTQIAYFVVVSGAAATLAMPWARRWIERWGAMRVYGAALLAMPVVLLPYGLIDAFPLLIIAQAVLGVGSAVQEVAAQAIMMEDAPKHKKEMDYFSDWQLVMQLGMAIGPMLTAILLEFTPVWLCFAVVAVVRVAVFWMGAKAGAESEMRASAAFRFFRSTEQ